jgi:hypothetical protein
MRKAKHLDISSRLEATKKLGLVEDYSIEWPSKLRLSAPRVTVVGRSVFPAQVTKKLCGYLACAACSRP